MTLWSFVIDQRNNVGFSSLISVLFEMKQLFPTGNWWFNPISGWYPYSFDHSVDLRGDNGPETMFVERSLVRKSI